MREGLWWWLGGEGEAGVPEFEKGPVAAMATGEEEGGLGRERALLREACWRVREWMEYGEGLGEAFYRLARGSPRGCAPARSWPLL